MPLMSIRRPGPAAFCGPLPFGGPRLMSRVSPGPRLMRRRPPVACVAQTRTLPVVSAPMTGGADVLFPGGSQLLQLKGNAPVDALLALGETEPPEFAYVPVDAWGVPADVGTVAMLDDLQLDAEKGNATMVCSGVCRFRVVERAEDGSTATVRPFHDDPPKDEDTGKIEKLEESLVESMKEIVRMSIKLSGAENNAGKESALEDTLKRVEAFCTSSADGEDPEKVLQENPMMQHWVVGLEDDRRREILGFIVIDLLSLSYMARRSVLLSTDTKARLKQAKESLEPFIKELAAKGAIVSALGRKEAGE